MLADMRTPSRPLDLGRVFSRVVDWTLEHIEPEVDRLMVGGALVERRGDHFRIERGGESCEELEAQALRLQGLCDCGAMLCRSGNHARCPKCSREFRLA
jgi:hypothetical protein